MYDAEMRNVMTMATVKAIAYEDQDRADGAALRRLTWDPKTDEWVVYCPCGIVIGREPVKQLPNGEAP